MDNTNWDVPLDWALACRWRPDIVLPFMRKKVAVKRKDPLDYERNFTDINQAMQGIPDFQLSELAERSSVVLICSLRDADYAAFDVDLDHSLSEPLRRSYGNPVDPTTWTNYETQWQEYLDHWREFLPADQYRDAKIKLVEWSLDNHHVRRSTNGGFHIVVTDPDKLLRECHVKLCEVKRSELLFIKPNSNDRPIAPVSGLLLDAVRNDTKTATPLPPLASDRAAISLFSDSDQLSPDSRDRLHQRLISIARFTYHHANKPGVSLLHAIDPDGAMQLLKYFQGILTADEFIEFCKTQPYQLKSGETEADYWSALRARFESLEPRGTVQDRLNQYYAFDKQRMTQAELIAGMTVAEFELLEQSSSDNLDDTLPVKFDKSVLNKLEPVKSDDPWDVPRGHITAVFGPSNVGKSSLVIAKAIEFSHAGKRILYINNDMSLAEMRPFLYGYGLADNSEFYIWDDRQILTASRLQHAINYVKPDLLIIDTLDTAMYQINDLFIPDNWKGCQDGIAWLKQLLRDNNHSFGLLGVYHTPKIRPGCFTLPHSAKLKGFLYRSYLVMDLGHAIANSWHRKDILKPWHNENPESLLVYPDKVRGADKRDAPDGWFIDFIEKIPSDRFHPDDGWRPNKPSEWEAVKRVHVSLFSADGDDRRLTVDKLIDKLSAKYKPDELMLASAITRIMRPYSESEVKVIVDTAVNDGRLFPVSRTNHDTWRYRLTAPDKPQDNA